jgi:Eukaryotic membrane protein family
MIAAVGQIILFGFAICLDSFLYTFTILPLRFAVALSRIVRNFVGPRANRSAVLCVRLKRYNAIAHLLWDRRQLAVSHKCDLVKGTLVVVSCFALHHITDASRMYHSVRGQETIKLYVIFNVLEVHYQPNPSK